MIRKGTRTIRLTDYFMSEDNDMPKNALLTSKEFRDVILIPAMREDKHIRLNIDGVRVNRDEFADVVIGGLLYAGYSKKEILDKIDFVYDDYATFYPINSLLNSAYLMLLHITGLHDYAVMYPVMHWNTFRYEYLPKSRRPFYISVQELTDAVVAYISEVCGKSEEEIRQYITIPEKSRKNLEDLINAVT